MLERAEELYRSILATQTDTAEVRLRLGRVLQLSGGGEKALRELKRSLELAEDSEVEHVAHILLGETCYQMGRLSEAIQSYRAALDIDPHCQVAAVALSHALHRAGDWAGSRQVMHEFFNHHAGRSSGKLDPWLRYVLGNPESMELALGEMRRELLR